MLTPYGVGSLIARKVYQYPESSKLSWNPRLLFWDGFPFYFYSAYFSAMFPRCRAKQYYSMGACLKIHCFRFFGHYPLDPTTHASIPGESSGPIGKRITSLNTNQQTFFCPWHTSKLLDQPQIKSPLQLLGGACRRPWKQNFRFI